MFKVVSLFFIISIFSVAQANETVEFETAQELLTVMEVDIVNVRWLWGYVANR